MKNRDLWDISWLSQNNIKLNKDLILKKLGDRKRPKAEFFDAYNEKFNSLDLDFFDVFIKEMQRFLYSNAYLELSTDNNHWKYLKSLLVDILDKIKHI